MTKTIKAAVLLVSAAFLAGALCVPAMAQEEEANGTAAPAQPEAVKKPAGTAKKPAAKKKAAKKNKAARPEAVSEYKFQNPDAQAAYTFDKKGDPIVKKRRPAKTGPGKNKMKTAKGMKQTAVRSLPKLHSKGASASSTARYVCPMGDYEGAKPGQCPKCGMNLVEKK